MVLKVNKKYNHLVPAVAAFSYQRLLVVLEVVALKILQILIQIDVIGKRFTFAERICVQNFRAFAAGALRFRALFLVRFLLFLVIRLDDGTHDFFNHSYEPNHRQS